MQLAQSKLLELTFMALLFVALIGSAVHAKDIATVRYHKQLRDDSGTTYKIKGDLHNHIDKFSFKSLKLATPNTFATDHRSLKKQFVSNKRLQNLLD